MFLGCVFVGLVGFRFLLVVWCFCRDYWWLLCYVGLVVGIAFLLALVGVVLVFGALF